MEDLVTTITRIESLKSLAQKKKEAKKIQKKMAKKGHYDSSLELSLMDAMGALDFGSSFTEDKAFFDIDSALAARKGGFSIDDDLNDNEF